MKTKKGISLQQAPSVVIMLVLIGMIIGAGALALNAFSTSLTAGSTAKLAVDNVSQSIGNAAAQFPTIGTIIGVVILIVIVISGFSWAMGRKAE